MPYYLDRPESEVLQDGQFVNALGKTECVEFVRQATGAPRTSLWTKGQSIIETQPGLIQRGVAIATFDNAGRYPTDNQGKHAAVYLWHDPFGIRVLDQWNAIGHVRERTIHLKKMLFPRSDCAKWFFIIE